MDPQPQFGRLIAPDPRDAGWNARRLIDVIAPPDVFPRGIPPGTRYYNASAILDQGDTGTCVLHGVASFLEGAPIMRPQTPDTAPFPMYDIAIARDEFRENDYDPHRVFGTSVRAGIEVPRALGLVSNYLWATTIEDAIQWHLANLGTVIIGMIWRSGMMRTDLDGFIHATGPAEGGHAFKTTGYSHERRAFRGQQSWGIGWGQKGRFWLLQDDLEEQLASGAAEICCPTQVRITI